MNSQENKEEIKDFIIKNKENIKNYIINDIIKDYIIDDFLEFDSEITSFLYDKYKDYDYNEEEFLKFLDYNEIKNLLKKIDFYKAVYDEDKYIFNSKIKLIDDLYKLYLCKYFDIKYYNDNDEQIDYFEEELYLNTEFLDFGIFSDIFYYNDILSNYIEKQFEIFIKQK